MRYDVFFTIMSPLALLFLVVFTDTSMNNKRIDMFSWHGDCYLFMMIRHDIDSLHCKAHKRSYKAFVKVHRGVGRVGEKKPLRAYLSTAMTRSFVVK